ncbi:MAG TPA: cyclase family protein [Terriglobia bacterium]|nr:cyclase family protein [Terriglobia bacterium]
MNLTNLISGLRQARMVDLSQTLEEHIPNFPTHSKFFHDMWGSYWHGDRALTYQLVMNEHNGTHVDAPAHFISDATPEAHTTIEQIEPNRLIGRGVRIDCRGLKEGDYLPVAHIREWESKHGAIEAGDIVLFNFGWSEHWGLRPANRRYLTDWPGVSMEAAEYLVSKSIAAMGVDSLSPDPPAALASNPIHRMVLEKQVLIIENLTRLEELPDFFLFIALPLKIRKGSGSPVRAIALI